MENKHYIRLDGTTIVKGFSDAFETPLETDICIGECGRHFELFGEVNPQLQDMNGYLYKYVDGVVVKESTLATHFEDKKIYFRGLQDNQIMDLLRWGGSL
jgi:hypothetical protein